MPRQSSALAFFLFAPFCVLVTFAFVVKSEQHRQIRITKSAECPIDTSVQADRAGHLRCVAVGLRRDR